MAEGTGDTVAGHGPEEGVQSRRLLAEKVPGRVVGRGSLGDLAVGLGLDGVDQVGELGGRLDEEDGDVVANNVKVALVGVPVCVCKSLIYRLAYR